MNMATLLLVQTVILYVSTTINGEAQVGNTVCSSSKPSTIAQVVIGSNDLRSDIDFLTTLTFRLDHIFPADDPRVAVMSGHGMSIRLDKSVDQAPPIIYIQRDTNTQDMADDDETEWTVTAPNGAIFKYIPQPLQLYTARAAAPPNRVEVAHLDAATWTVGRAGMLYRNLIASRLNGSIMASHIRIPHGGPVGDMVHFHTAQFQLIFCIHGWVRLVYEDMGEPFILESGDCVTQPPEIRHQVLEASDDLQVIELVLPHDHMTTIDHDMQLPTNQYRPSREWKGQTFVHHTRKDAVWKPWHLHGFVFRDTGIFDATKGLASVHVAKVENVEMAATLSKEFVAPPKDVDILLFFVLHGELDVETSNKQGTVETLQMKTNDALVITSGIEYRFLRVSVNLQIVQASFV